MKNRDKLFHTIAYISFYTAVFIEVLMVVIDKSNFTNPIEGRLFQLTFVLCFVKVCLTRYTFREYVLIFLFCVLGTVSYLITGRNEVLRLVMLVAACKSIDIKKCLKIIFWITFAGCFVIIFLAVTGIYGNVSLTMDFGRGGVETRYTLGMGHPNALHCMIWALMTLGLYLYADIMKWYCYVGALIINFGVYCLSGSRTSFFVGCFTILMFYLADAKKADKVKKICACIEGGTTIGSIVLSVYIAANAYRVYNYDWHRWEEHDVITMIFVKVNNILNGRIRILTETPGWEGSIKSWSLFSKPETEYYFDMGWIRLFYWYGIVPACIFVAVLLALIIYCYRKRQYLVITLITAFSVYTLIEAHAISDYLARNYTFFVIGEYWYQMMRKGAWKKECVNEENTYC